MVDVAGMDLAVAIGDPLTSKSVTVRDEDQTTAWALAAGEGDRSAAESFILATQRDAWRFLAHLTNPGHADDLTQETYLRAFLSLPRFAGRSTARTWLLSIARRVAADHLRGAYRRPRTSARADWVAEADRAQHRGRDRIGFEDLVELNQLLDELDPLRRQALVLTQVLGFGYAEAARVCGCPVGTIRSRVARARIDLLRAHHHYGP
jgi:RNA polymerase sigma-70 factor (ECF subfamily)